MNLEINASNWGPWYDSFQIHINGSGDPVYHSFSVYSESDGDIPADNDDIIDAGEIIVFDLTIKNLGGANLYGISGLLEENDPYIIISDNSSDFGNVDSEGGENSGRFAINISGACPDKHLIGFNLNLTDNEGTLWKLTFSLIVNGTPDYNIYTFNIIEYDGDGDNYVDAGESWYADIYIENIGEATGQNLFLFLDSSDPYVSFCSSYRNLTLGSINVNEIVSYDNKTLLEDYWRFTISEKNTPSNYEINFTITIIDDLGIYKNFQLNIIVTEGVSATDVNGELDIIIAVTSMLIAFSIVGSLALFFGNHKYALLKNLKRKRQIKPKEKEYDSSKPTLDPKIRKILYFTPIIVFFIAWWADVGIAISYLGPYLENQDLTIVSWAFSWAELTDDFLIYTNTFSSFFFGCYSWSIITYYLGTKNPERFMRSIKSIYLCYPFWFGMCIYLGIIGAGSYLSLIHI